MHRSSPVRSLRFRYVLGLSMIALLVTGSFVTMQLLVSKQENFSHLIGIAGRQSGLADRIVHFASRMVRTEDEEEFRVARSQLGLAVSTLVRSHNVLMNGSPEDGLPKVWNPTLEVIYFDPVSGSGLDAAVQRYVKQARKVYDAEFGTLSPNSAAFLFVDLYGPHVLDALFSAAADEYEAIAHEAILQIERLEVVLWITALLTLIAEALWIFRPLESRVCAAFRKIAEKNAELQHSVAMFEQAESRLREGEERFRSLLYSAGEGIVGVNNQGECTFGNPAAATLLGFDNVEQLSGLHIHELVHGAHGAPDAESAEGCPICANWLRGRAVSSAQESFVRRDRTILPVAFRLQPIIKDGVKMGFVLSFNDISERLEAERQMVRQASYDSLTGLPNRAIGLERLSQALALCARSDEKVAVMLLDLDQFKRINDTFGHAAGDQLLIQTASRLGHNLRRTDVVARLGGDEFLIITQNLRSTADADSAARNVLSLFDEPFELAGNESFVTASVGVAVHPEDGDDVEGLLRKADAAMYRSKERGRNGYHFFTEDMDAEAQERSAILSRMRYAIDLEEMHIAYQAIVDTESEATMGVEALLRWQNPELGNVAPIRFIPLAEESGLIVPMGQWVLRTACRQVAQWQRRHAVPIRLAVNVSARQFRGEGLFDTVMETLAESGLASDRLELEITESLLLQDVPETLTLLKRLRDHGVRLSVDDFGTGYSALSYLKRFPLTGLKIDRSFIQDVTTDRQSVLVAAIVGMARSLGLEVTAEGVETPEQHARLRELGCPRLQGYLYGKPCDAWSFDSRLADELPPLREAV